MIVPSSSVWYFTSFSLSPVFSFVTAAFRSLSEVRIRAMVWFRSGVKRIRYSFLVSVSSPAVVRSSPACSSRSACGFSGAASSGVSVSALSGISVSGSVPSCAPASGSASCVPGSAPALGTASSVTAGCRSVGVVGSASDITEEGMLVNSIQNAHRSAVNLRVPVLIRKPLS